MRQTGRLQFGGQDDVAKVRDAADIVRIVGEYVQLRPAGREFKGLCPFHDDHNPSMAVVPHKGIFHCFVCGAGGDAIAFVRRYLKMEFREALEFLAEKLGVEISPRRQFVPADGDPGTSRQDLLKANAIAAGFYKTLLSHDQHGKAGRDIIQRRGISAEMVEKFLIGVSPGGERWDGFAQYLHSQGHNERLFVEAGLLKPRDSGGVYDAFRNRLIFPIQDTGGRVIAFGARRIDDQDDPKYLNSPETRLFQKKSTLYALNHASREIQLRRTAIITEGYTDTIACHQAGVTNAVATLGTALTDEHATVLRRICTTIVLLFDGDDAGQRAADRAVQIFFAEPLDVKIATLAAHTDAKDPDELLKRPDGRAIFDKAIASAQDLLTYRFARLRKSLEGAGISRLSKAIDDEIASLIDMGLKEVPPVRQKLIVQKLATLAGVGEAVIERAIPAGRSSLRPAAPPSHSDADQSEPDATNDALPAANALTPNEHLLGCILCGGELWTRLSMGEQDAVAPTAYRWPLIQRLAQLVRDIVDDGRAPSLREVLGDTEDLGIHNAAVMLASCVDNVTDRSKRLTEHFDSCVRTIRLDRERAASPAGSSVIDAIELKRQSLSKHGHDRRILPRPH